MAQIKTFSARALHKRCGPVWAVVFAIAALATSLNAADTAQHQLLQPQGTVEVMRKGTQNWALATTNIALFPGDAVRTGKDSRAAVRLVNESVIRLNELTIMRFPEPASARKRFLIHLLKGAAYFFHRERPVQTDFETPLVSGAIRGTEFNLEVADNGRTVLTLLDGAVELANAQGQLALQTGEQAVVEPAAAPKKTAVLQSTNVNAIQWCLYYPAIIDLAELGLSPAEEQALIDSLKAYREGDLPRAAAAYPTARAGTSSAEKIYAAQLKLAVGQVAEAETLLNGIGAAEGAYLASALRTLIAAVQFRDAPAIPESTSGSVLLAKSYYAQSRFHLAQALEFAREASQRQPKFGFAWGRLAELQFGFGNRKAAEESLGRAMKLSPVHAQAMSTWGFVLAAKGDFSGAQATFNRAITLDSALGNAW
ncbi:MAG TPA: FecR domain-containing protein, partial [Verrucomicrobiae bacterium]